MSKAKTSVLVIGLIAVVAVAFVGASSYVASSSKDSGVTAASCDTGAHAQAAATGSPSACAAKNTSKSCSVARASTEAGKGCSAAASCPMSKAGCSKTCGGKASKTAEIESIQDREGKTLVLAGRYVCGSCELGVSDQCRPAFRTKDGKNYLLVKNNLSTALHEKGRDKDVEIVSRVKKMDGVKYLEVEAIRAAS